MSSQISIHALLAESDCYSLRHSAPRWHFYPRSPCGERPLLSSYPGGSGGHFYPRSPCGERQRHEKIQNAGSRLFLSTLSLRRATCQWRRSVKLFRQFLSTLSLRRATLTDDVSTGGKIFLSTLSLRRATTWARGSRVTYVISIHALLAESDCSGNQRPPGTTNFYPRSPCGERRPLFFSCWLLAHFYPRSPCGERRQTPNPRRSRL